MFSKIYICNTNACTHYCIPICMCTHNPTSLFTLFHTLHPYLQIPTCTYTHRVVDQQQRDQWRQELRAKVTLTTSGFLREQFQVRKHHVHTTYTVLIVALTQVNCLWTFRTMVLYQLQMHWDYYLTLNSHLPLVNVKYALLFAQFYVASRKE